MPPPRIAFLGLGTMGSGMAWRLLGAGFPLTVYNRNRTRTAPLAQGGAHVAATPREAAAGADIVICMVADDVASRSVWLGEHGALAGAARGAVLVESSTLTVGWVKALAEAATAQGHEFLDAPVAGSKTQAAAGELNFFVGGSSGALDKIRPALAVMGRSIVHLGGSGSGALVKLINNFMAGVQVASLAEALGMIERSGLDRAQALAVLTEGAPGSPLVRTVAARMTAADFTPNFQLGLLVKDLKYAREEGSHLGLTLDTAGTALAIFERSLEAGHGSDDMAAVVEQFRNY